jgi:acetyl-CoA carboxylase carboxyl transferase subunit beta
MENAAPEITCRACSKDVRLDAFLRAHKVCPACGYHHVLTARERLELLVDAGTFREFAGDLRSVNALEFPGYEEKLASEREKTGLPSEMLAGQAAISGNAVILGITDMRFMMGSMGAVVGEKTTLCFERALARRLPAVIVSASGGGARMQEGTVALMQMAKTSGAVMKHHKEGLFFVSVITHPTMGGTAASFVSLGDVILAEPGALIGFAGKRARAAIGEDMPDRLQSAESLLEHGMLDMVVTRSRLRAVLAALLDFVNARPPRRS